MRDHADDLAVVEDRGTGVAKRHVEVVVERVGVGVFERSFAELLYLAADALFINAVAIDSQVARAGYRTNVDIGAVPLIGGLALVIGTCLDGTVVVPNAAVDAVKPVIGTDQRLEVRWYCSCYLRRAR